MAVITKTVWLNNTSQGALTLDTQPDPDAYGLAVVVVTGELSTVNWTYFYDGTIVIDSTTKQIYYVKAGVLIGISTSGAVGPQGPPGPQGPAGPTGATGTQGPAGAQGPKGDKGDPGVQGVKGDTGTAGAPGATGAAGTYWFQGAAAPPAFPTAIGGVVPRVNDLYTDTVTGDVYKVVGSAWVKQSGSLRGPQGAQGVQGVQGTQGVKGDTGAQGPAGPAGADSTVPGPQGPAGAQGVKGDTGAQGPKGDKGDTGAQGPPGPAATVVWQ